MKVNFKSGLIFLSLLSSMLMVSACQEKPAPQAEQAATATQHAEIPLIQAKVERVNVVKKQFCDEDGCTQYDLQTVKSNVPWLDEYFLNRIKKDVPGAFEKDQNHAQAESEAQSSPKGLNQNSIYVRFISQQNNLATFVIQTYTYAAGAAHGMYHNEYVTFDLSTQKRLALTDILKPNVEAKVAEQLYDANANWLIQKDITRDKLQLSDNYYYGVNGLVFVYPLYELTSYAEGMPELKLPYQVAKDLIKAEYLPSLPQVEATVEKPVTP
ncbi:RsiV family protein [Acinetobacter guillouiae]|uniref:RsiV family protein n=1 Tax=Acinetobacter TaxID=469 RepID=UPI001FBB7DE5|nr:RsiV family protein [Acinetobacter sp. NyZ410]UOH19550.1 RsiV family protein [Acinetobacter sp. NyZ410]